MKSESQGVRGSCCYQISKSRQKTTTNYLAAGLAAEILGEPFIDTYFAMVRGNGDPAEAFPGVTMEDVPMVYALVFTGDKDQFLRLAYVLAKLNCVRAFALVSKYLDWFKGARRVYTVHHVGSTIQPLVRARAHVCNLAKAVIDQSETVSTLTFRILQQLSGTKTRFVPL